MISNKEGPPPSMTTTAFQRRQLIIQAISQPRLAPYLLEADGNQRQALRLYQWNLRASAAVYEQLSVVEVVLRNAMDAQLRAWHQDETGNPDWLLVETMTRPLHGLAVGKRRSAYNLARRSVTGREHSHPLAGEDLTHDDVLASTTFGMWKDLLPNHASNADPESRQNVGRQVLCGAKRSRTRSRTDLRMMARRSIGSSRGCMDCGTGSHIWNRY